MPELPEVQTIVDDLNRKIKGYEIVDFWSDWTKAIRGSMQMERGFSQRRILSDFKKGIIRREIVRAERKAKNILIYLSGEKILLIHLKMTGHLLVKSPNIKLQMPNKIKILNIKYKKDKYFDEKVNQYIHHIWFLRKGKQARTLEFSDLRKFGKIDLFNAAELEKRKDIQELGVEPLSKEFTPEKLKEILKKYPKRNVRMVLMDLKLIVGIGNIYASEIPFEAGISPKRRVGRITQKEIKKLHGSIIKVLKKATELRGTSDSDYRDTAGAPGSFQKVMKAYNREGQRCKRKSCSGIVKREKIGQRSAFFCPVCQK